MVIVHTRHTRIDNIRLVIVIADLRKIEYETIIFINIFFIVPPFIVAIVMASRAQLHDIIIIFYFCICGLWQVVHTIVFVVLRFSNGERMVLRHLMKYRARFGSGFVLYSVYILLL